MGRCRPTGQVADGISHQLELPEQRSCESTRLAAIFAGCSCRLGLRQRTKWACVELRSTISASRSLMKRRETELNAAPFRLPGLAASAGRKTAASSAFFDLPSASSKSACSVSLFLSRKWRAM